MIICPPVVSQYAAIGALEAGRAFVKGKVEKLARTRQLVKSDLQFLQQEGLADVPAATGALYFLLRLKSSLAPLDYAKRLIEEHRVAVIPGDAFGLTQGCHLRVAYGALQAETAAEGVGRLVRGVRALAS